ncbi:MAG TPA: GAF domain-containing protein [Terriglobales bacterium]|nr:GAF domain-containing protein [Terriglobales bacterium]
MGNRQKPRFRMVLPVSIWGTDTVGKAFHQLAYTLDISVGGARLAGVQAALNSGSVIAVRYKQRKARFRVVWMRDNQLGIHYVEGEKFIWIDLPEDDGFVDRDGVERPAALPSGAEPPAASADASQAEIEVAQQQTPPREDTGPVTSAGDAAESAPTAELATTLDKCLAMLRALTDLVNSAGMLPPVAQEFHAASAHLRNTAWAVEQWVELQGESRDKSHIVASVNSERVRFATQLCLELVLERQRLTEGVSQENREALMAAVQSLAQELGLGGQPRSRQSRVAKSDRADRVALLAGLNQEIRSSAFSAEETLQLMVERARSFTDADGAAIALRDEDEMVCCASSGVAPMVGVRFSLSGGLAGEAIANRRSVIWRDTEKDGRVDASLCRSLDLRSSALAPIVARDSVTGVLQVFAGSPDAFDEDSVSLLQHLAEFVASLEPGPGVASASS